MELSYSAPRMSAYQKMTSVEGFEDEKPTTVDIACGGMDLCGHVRRRRDVRSRRCTAGRHAAGTWLTGTSGTRASNTDMKLPSVGD